MKATKKTPDLFADGAVTVEGATKEFGITRTTLYALMKSGELPYSMPRGRRLIPRAALRALLAANVQPTAKN